MDCNGYDQGGGEERDGGARTGVNKTIGMYRRCSYSRRFSVYQMEDFIFRH